MSHRPILIVAAFYLVAALSSTHAADSKPVRFDRDIRPLLSDKCFYCHGPDDRDREAELRLDVKAHAFADRDGGQAFVPGKPEKSAAWLRITSADEAERMPPPEANKPLTPTQIDLMKRWIEQGAEWADHWAFVAPRRPELPDVADSSWVRNPIDRFILDRLRREGLEPSDQADRRTLIRRLSFDLTGLPPAPAEVAAFVNDKSEDAYEKLVDRLLASRHYGERMALM